MSADLPVPADLLGQETALRVLAAALSAGRVASAYLLHGPSGVGRTLGAEIFAAALLCAAPKDGTPCGRCRPCHRFTTGVHPDLLMLSAETGPFFKDDADADRARLDAFSRAARRAAKRESRRTIPVRAIRRLLDFVGLATAAGGRRVVVIDSFDEVEEAGTGTLLKVLEDAPRETTFLLLAGSVESVPDTILSRCQRVRFQPLAPEVVRRLLTIHADPAMDAGSREFLVRLAQGSAGRAIRAAELGVHVEGAAAARALCEGAAPEAGERAAAWIAAGTRDLALQRERVRQLVAAALLFAREGAAIAGPGGVPRLDALLPALRIALESIETNVAPDLVVRSLWARAGRALAMTN